MSTKTLSAPCDKDAFLPLVLPLWESVDFLVRWCFPSVIPSGVEGSTRSDFFFPARFQTNRFAAIPPRVRFGLRLAHLVGMTNKGARENRQSLSGGERAPLRRPREGPFSARLLRRATMISDGKVRVIAAGGFVPSPLTRSASSGNISEPSASRDSKAPARCLLR